jgi:hypothetical protein
MMPSRPFMVLAASASRRDGDLDLDIAASPFAAAISAIAARIICRGTGLMAGSPGGTGGPRA